MCGRWRCCRILVAALGLRAFAIRSEQKVRYHAAMSAAGRFTVALSAYAQGRIGAAGFAAGLAGLIGRGVDGAESGGFAGEAV